MRHQLINALGAASLAIIMGSAVSTHAAGSACGAVDASRMLAADFPANAGQWMS